jgi:pimeloyl-ACP methyl ester carboxylesterase
MLPILVGGPGDEVSSYAWSVALNDSRAAHFTGLEEYDFLAIDVRGTFSSNPLNCSFDGILPSFTPQTKDEYNAYLNLAQQAAKFCDANSSPKGIIKHVSSMEVVRDWESLRAALGYEEMHMLAYS